MLSDSKRNTNQIKKSNNHPAKQANTQMSKPQKDSSRTNLNKKNNKNEYQKRPSQRYNSESVVSRIANPRREETIEDIRMDIEKLEKEIQFEIKQIRSTKLGL